MRSWRHTTVVFLLRSALAATAAAWTAGPAPAASAAPAVTWTVTTGDQRQLAAAQPTVTFGPVQPTDYAWSAISVDDTRRFQRVQGMGAALTESSAVLLDRLPATDRARVLQQLFSPVTGAGISLVRVPLGASDFALSRYTYDDLPAGQTDPTLSQFSLAHDDAEIVPVLREALRINPALQVMGTPWCAPGLDEDQRSLIGGTLRDGYTDLYARYLVRTVQALRAAASRSVS